MMISSQTQVTYSKKVTFLKIFHNGFVFTGESTTSHVSGFMSTEEIVFERSTAFQKWQQKKS